MRTGVWQSAEDILILEARVLVKAIQRLAKTRLGACVRQLFLCDNMSVVLAFERCRSSSFGLLVQIRKFQAYVLASGIQVSVRWIPSELNESDEGSRLASETASKLATHLVDARLEREFVQAGFAQRNSPESGFAGDRRWWGDGAMCTCEIMNFSIL